MQLRVLAVGTKMPSWVQEAVADYGRRMPRELRVDWCEISPAKRQSGVPDRYREHEAAAIRRKLRADDVLVALDVAGTCVSTVDVAMALDHWQMQGDRVAILIGGPDGLHQSLLAEARSRWSLGRITMPHPLVRVVLAEQLYRGWSVNAGHPYHRA